LHPFVGVGGSDFGLELREGADLISSHHYFVEAIRSRRNTSIMEEAAAHTGDESSPPSEQAPPTNAEEEAHHHPQHKLPVWHYDVSAAASGTMLVKDSGSKAAISHLT